MLQVPFPPTQPHAKPSLQQCRVPRLPSPVSSWLLLRIFCCFSFSFMISIIFFLVTCSTPRLLNLEKRDHAEIWECQGQEQQAQMGTYSCSWEGPEHRAVPLRQQAISVCAAEEEQP